MMIIDAHCHYFETEGGLDFVKGASFEEHVQDMESANIDKFILFTLNGLFGDYRRANDNLAVIASRYPDMVIPFGTFNPWYGQDALDEIDRCMNVLGFRGFKLHPWMTGFPINSEMLNPFLEKIMSYDVPVLIHSGTPPWSEPLQIGEVARRFPELRIVMAHMGIIDLWKEAIDAAKSNKNIWLETSGVPGSAIKIAVEEVGPERIVFGSDSPYGGQGGHLFQMNKIRFLDLGTTATELILGGNIQRILGI
ncbi:MAG TPA: amidohydrolase family protein [Bacillota bacterium]|mgnify:CR=1 FL=1|jgi:predicted TIM-barrel fold metal-dependent hydrolase|nr:amidohydrolase family protein [Bacillota bacterium]